MNRSMSYLFAWGILLLSGLLFEPTASAQTIHFGNAISQTLPKIVKIVGSGGSRGLEACLLYTSPSPRDKRQSRMPSSA